MLLARVTWTCRPSPTGGTGRTGWTGRAAPGLLVRLATDAAASGDPGTAVAGHLSSAVLTTVPAG